MAHGADERFGAHAPDFVKLEYAVGRELPVRVVVKFAEVVAQLPAGAAELEIEEHVAEVEDEVAEHG